MIILKIMKKLRMMQKKKIKDDAEKELEVIV